MSELSPDDYPPTRDEVINSLMLTGECFTEDFTRLKSHLDRIAPVRAQFTVTDPPPGYAPDEVREQWVGITLPIRGFFNPREGVGVLAREALELLRDKSPLAYDWWQNHYAEEAQERIPNADPENFPAFLANISHLIFDYRCGQYELV